MPTITAPVVTKQATPINAIDEFIVKMYLKVNWPKLGIKT